MNSIIVNASEIATPIGKTAKYGKEMNNITVIENGAIVIEEGIIQAVDSTDNILKHYDINKYNVIDAKGKAVIPGFVDSHTHFIFGGYREEEFLLRLKGSSYIDILKANGGIQNSVNNTRQSSFEQLYELGLERLNSMLSFGVTTVEGKSGYGLDFDTEIKQLEVMKKLEKAQPIDIVSTFLGAHAIPKEYKDKNSEYIQFIIEEVLSYVAENKLADFCDVFCEEAVFSIELSKLLLSKAKELGMGLKIHADEITQLGGAELAAELGATSADHLLNISENGIRLMAENKVIATLLPATAFCLKEPYAKARKIMDSGCAVALATDFNPGSCFTNSIPLVIALACINMDMTVEETLTALTLNGAAALNRASDIGSIEKGKAGDVIILKYPSYKYLPYHTGVNIVEKVIKKGSLVYENNI